jgi:uncharacterized phiE125 gp8 family phage protein
MTTKAAGYSIEVVESSADTTALLAELKTHLRLNDDSEDTLLSRYLSTACEMFVSESRGYVPLQTTFRQHFTSWSELKNVGLSRSPVISVDAVTYYDEDDEQQTLADWEADLSGLPPLVYLPAGITYPLLSESIPRPITIEYIAGADPLPDDVTVALFQCAAHFYKEREAYSTNPFTFKDVPLGFRRIADKYHRGKF